MIPATVSLPAIVDALLQIEVIDRVFPWPMNGRIWTTQL